MVQPDLRAERRLQAAYALAASRYARWVAPRFRPLARDLLASPQPPLGPGLDVGSGTGAALAEWRRLVPGASLLAVDLTAEMLFRSSAAWRVAADATALPLRDASFRTVISVFALHHLPDPGAALREWARVLASGGELRLATWGKSEPTLWDAFDHALADLGLSEGPRLAPRTHDAPDALRATAESAGFVAVDVVERLAAFAFRDVAAFWRWRTAFPGAARLLAELPAARRTAVRGALARRLAAWPAPLVSRHPVLFLRARRA